MFDLISSKKICLKQEFDQFSKKKMKSFYVECRRIFFYNSTSFANLWNLFIDTKVQTYSFKNFPYKFRIDVCRVQTRHSRQYVDINQLLYNCLKYGYIDKSFLILLYQNMENLLGKSLSVSVLYKGCFFTYIWKELVNFRFCHQLYGLMRMKFIGFLTQIYLGGNRSETR